MYVRLLYPTAIILENSDATNTGRKRRKCSPIGAGLQLPPFHEHVVAVAIRSHSKRHANHPRYYYGYYYIRSTTYVD